LSEVTHRVRRAHYEVQAACKPHDADDQHQDDADQAENEQQQSPLQPTVPGLRAIYGFHDELPLHDSFLRCRLLVR
jgi:hypothetical protein